MKIEIKPYDDSFVAVSFPEGFNTDLLNSVRKIPKTTVKKPVKYIKNGLRLFS